MLLRPGVNMYYLAKIKLLCVVSPFFKEVGETPACNISKVVCFSCYSRQQQELQELLTIFSKKTSNSFCLYPSQLLQKSLIKQSSREYEHHRNGSQILFSTWRVTQGISCLHVCLATNYSQGMQRDLYRM